MSREVEGADVQMLAALSTALHEEYREGELAWEGSPFGWIKRRPSRQVGAIGEKLVSGWLAARDFDVCRSPDAEADRVVNGTRVEVKFSTLWQNGTYRFQQLRDQNYELAVCLGVSPFKAHCWVVPKSEILRRWAAGDGIVPQHRGARGSDTAWLRVCPEAPDSWLAEFGGTLGAAIQVLETFLSDSQPVSI